MLLRSESGRQYVYNVRINDWLIVMLLSIPFKNVSLRQERSHYWWMAANFRPLLATCLKQGGLFIVPHLLWHGAIVNTISSKGKLRIVTSYNKPEVLRTHFNLDPHKIINGTWISVLSIWCMPVKKSFWLKLVTFDGFISSIPQHKYFR